MEEKINSQNIVSPGLKPQSKYFLITVISLVMLSIGLTGGFLLSQSLQNQNQEAVQPTVIPNTLRPSTALPTAKFKFTDQTSVTSVPATKINYTVPSDWKKTTLKSGLTLCLPPKWEYNGFADLEFNRDPGYKPTITTIQNIPYSGGSKRVAYFNFWNSEYPDVSNLVSVEETDINGNSALTIYPNNSAEVKQSPEGLAVVWFVSGKLWKAGLSSWSYINPSQKDFLTDFYKAISCGF